MGRVADAQAADQSPETAVALQIVLDEAAIRRSAGGPDVMAAQLCHLADLVRRPNIDIRVLPIEKGEHASPDGGFRLIKMADPFPLVAHVEGPGGSLYVESGEAERLDAMYDRVRKVALSAEDSADFLAAVAEEPV